jgi:hypothetical protein
MSDDKNAVKGEWTTERPDAPGFYWWARSGQAPEIVRVERRDAWPDFRWAPPFNDRVGSPVYTDIDAPSGSLWWPVRLEHPPVG